MTRSLFDLDNRQLRYPRHTAITKTRLAHLHTLPTVLAVALVIMTSASTNHDVDLEAQQVIWPPPGTSHDLPYLSERANVLGKELGGGEVHEMRTHPSEMKSDASRVPSLPTHREADLETQPVVPQSTGATSFLSPSYPKSDIPHR